MNFDLNEEQLLMEETLDKMLSKEYDLRWVRQIFESPSGWDAEFWAQLCGLGIFGAMVPEGDGGSGLGLLDLVVVAESLGYHSAPGPFADHVLATLAISRWGTEHQKSHWLSDLINGRRRGTVALGEPNDAWTFPQWSVGGVRTDGEKVGVLYPHDADVFIVGSSDGLFLIDAAADGITIGTEAALDRTRRCGKVAFRDVPADPIRGSSVAELLDVALILLAADAAGGARRCLDMTTEYAKNREQFGVPIGSFQAVKHQLAEMAVDVLPVRYLVWYAAHCFDNSIPEASKLASLAKARSGEVYLAAARRSVELHGGIGYTWECDVQFFLKRAILDRTLLGTPSAHYRRVAAINGWSTLTAED